MNADRRKELRMRLRQSQNARQILKIDADTDRAADVVGLHQRQPLRQIVGELG